MVPSHFLTGELVQEENRRAEMHFRNLTITIAYFFQSGAHIMLRYMRSILNKALSVMIRIVVFDRKI